MSINIADLSDSPHLASGDFEVGQILPAVMIERVHMGDIPIEGSQKVNRRGVVTFRGAKKTWVMSKTRGRDIAQMSGVSPKGIDVSFVGVTLQLIVVDGIKNPRGGAKTTGFRVHKAWPPGQGPLAAPGKAPADPMPPSSELGLPA